MTKQTIKERIAKSKVFGRLYKPLMRSLVTGLFLGVTTMLGVIVMDPDPEIYNKHRDAKITLDNLTYIQNTNHLPIWGFYGTTKINEGLDRISELDSEEKEDLGRLIEIARQEVYKIESDPKLNKYYKRKRYSEIALIAGGGIAFLSSFGVGGLESIRKR